MRASEADRIYTLMGKKYEDNPVMDKEEVGRRKRTAKSKRWWANRGLVRERGQILLYESAQRESSS